MNEKAKDALGLIKNNIVSIVTKALMGKIVKSAKYMAWGPVNSLASFLITKIIRAALDHAVLELYILKGHYDIDKEIKEVNEILKDINSEIDDDKKKEIDVKLKSAFDKLFSF